MSNPDFVEVVRLQGEEVERLLNTRLTRAGHHFTLKGIIAAWEGKEGADMGYRVKRHWVDKGTNELVLEVEPT